MPTTKAQQRAVSKYTKENYDEIKVRVPKGQKELIRAHAKDHDDGSVNGFINRAIDYTTQEDLNKEAHGMPIYTIIGGVNGSGKSSLTGSLKYQRSDLGRIIDVDKLAKERESFIEGGKTALRLQNEYIRARISFTQETTLSGQRPVRTAKQAKAAGYTVRLFYVGISSAEEALQRIANRVRKGGHDIPAEDVFRRYQERYESLSAILPYIDEGTFFDNENGFVEVAEYRNGELRCIGEYRPTWLKELLEYLNKVTI